MKKSWFVKQMSLNECGIACLNMILNYYDINVSYKEIKEKFKLSKEGVSAFDIIKVSNEYGIEAKGYKNFDLDNIKSPVIAHIINDNNMQHFVVIEKKIKDKLVVLDTFLGCYEVLLEEFKKRYTTVAITFNPRESLPIKNVLKYKKIIIKISFLTFIWSLICIFYSYTLSLSINLLNKKLNIRKLILILLMIILIGIIKEIIYLLKNSLSLKFKIVVDKILTKPAINKFFSLPLNFYKIHSDGELISKLNDLSYVKDMISKLVEVLFSSIILIFICIVFLSCYSIYFLIVTILFILIYFIFNYSFYKKYDYKTYDLQAKSENFNASLINYFNNIFTIKNHMKEKYFINKSIHKYNLLIEDYNNLSTKYIKREFINNVLEIIFDVFIIFVGVKSSFETSKILFVVMLDSLMLGAINSIYSVFSLFSDFKNAIKRINMIYKEKSISLSKEKLNLSSVEYKNLYFKNNNKLLLKNISLFIKKGDFIHVTGKTGTGKSTLFKLLNKEYYTNQIYVNNKCINDIKESTLKKDILYVDQKQRLMNDTIYNNIFMGNKINNIPIKTSLVDKLIIDNNLDYKYLIDSNNSNLSAGAVQKIIIAQSLASNKKIIIFDETTSNLDVKEERIILKNIKNNYKDISIVLITHRNSNLDLFNKKYILEDGYLRKDV